MKNITAFGNATKNAEVRTTQGGNDICSFSIAVNDRRTKQATYFDVAYWGKPGVAVAPYITKGTPVVVSGDFTTREYNGKTYLQINANAVSLAGRGKGGDSTPGYDQSPAPRDDLDDEIPF